MTSLKLVIAAGLFSLGGVILGVLATTGTQLFLEKKRDKREVRRAARLIDSDLMFAEVVAEICVEKKTWWVKDDRLTSDGWQQYRDIIAASQMSWKDWVAVNVAVQAIGHLQGSRDVALKIQQAEMTIDPEMVSILAAAERLGLDVTMPSSPIPKDMVARIKPKLAHIKAGRDALAPLAQNPVKRPY